MLVDASPEVVQNYSDSLNRIYKMYNLTEANSRNVPELKFEGLYHIGKSLNQYSNEHTLKNKITFAMLYV